jgi:hypothetical protein
MHRAPSAFAMSIYSFPVLGRGCHRSNVGIGQHRITFAGAASEIRKAVAEGFPDRVLHEHAGASDAGLAGRGEYARDDPGKGGVNIAIIENDIRRLAAEFERYAL